MDARELAKLSPSRLKEVLAQANQDRAAIAANAEGDYSHEDLADIEAYLRDIRAALRAAS